MRFRVPPTPRRHPFSLHQTRALPALALAIGVFGAATPRALAQVDLSSLHARIVNGAVTSAYPSTGALLVFEDSSATSLYGLCSGTLIGCRTFLTAAHCVCPDDASDARTCERQGTTDPATMRVFFQHAGYAAVESVAIHPDYSFAEQGDLAVLTLSHDVTGIAPTAINTTAPPAHGTQATIVGFGTSGDGFTSANDAGVKRVGQVTTAACSDGIADAGHVCWQFSGAQSNICSGDSGGPLFADLGGSAVVAAVTSGSFSFDCQPPDMSFDSDVYVFRHWVASAAAAGLGTSSCGLPAAAAFTGSGRLRASAPQARLQFDVPADTARLRVALNGQLGSDGGFFGGSNDFDLYLRAGGAATADTYDCADTNPTTFGFCEVDAPHAGTWHALVQLSEGDGLYQLTATTFAALGGACACDCDGDSEVVVAELLESIDESIAGKSGACDDADANGDGTVTVDELILGVRAQLGLCEAS